MAICVNNSSGLQGDIDLVRRIYGKIVTEEDFIFLDLNEIELFGWKIVEYKGRVDEYLEAIRIGVELTHVEIVRDGNDFRLVYGRDIDHLAEGGLSDGFLYDISVYDGHCRSIARYITSTPLKVRVVPEREIPPLKVNIRDVEIV